MIEDAVADAAEAYYQRRKRHGLSRDVAAAEMRRNSTLIGAMLLCSGKADGLLCGTFGAYANHLRYVDEVIGLAEGAHSFAAMSLLQLPRQHCFICDPYINLDPTAEEIAEMAMLAAAELRRFRPDAAHRPRVALQLRDRQRSVGTQDAGRARADQAPRPRISRSKARCMPMRRSPGRCSTASSRTHGFRPRRTS